MKTKNKKKMFAKIPLDLKNLFASNIGHKEYVSNMNVFQNNSYVIELKSPYVQVEAHCFQSYMRHS